MSHKVFIILVFFVLTPLTFAQTITLQGRVQSSAEVANIHVINQTAQKFTITNAEGAFNIDVALNDTLVFSSIQHKKQVIVVNATIVNNQTLLVVLEEHVNELNQVVVGKLLTGNIRSDVSNVEGEPMTALKAGIPSYQGPLKTQSERRLIEATSGGGLIPFAPIINALSGRTKELKKRVELEEKSELIKSYKHKFSEALFAKQPLPPGFIWEFFYFVSEQPDFLERCKDKTDVVVLEYLLEKRAVFNKNRGQVSEK
ncbi:hypothetical protein ACFSQP_08650 [Bizionia sediminis]|uniref:Carboxypeptidase-like regulatory domain-containing protein n=1 Tax=Bizionia sediminis TaxID=1737064 RepID=A0ABW5KU99_9FLAO